LGGIYLPFEEVPILKIRTDREVGEKKKNRTAGKKEKDKRNHQEHIPRGWEEAKTYTQILKEN